MPTISRKRVRGTRPEISQNVLHYLTTGEGLERSRELFMMSNPARRDRLRPVWESCRAEIMRDWIKDHPGSRPWAWWELVGPREDTGTGAYFEPLPVPRRRLSGKGQMTWERFPSVVPRYSFGLPDSWAAIDEDDPPRYESEAAFLDRQGLLSETEKRFLAKNPGLLEPETVRF